jgi:hypothetical protein
MDVEQLAGSFVVEVGYRQAWPFLGFCDNQPTPPQETRLSIDASWTIEANPSVAGSASDDVTWLTAATAFNGTTIDTARVGDDGSIRLTTDSGSPWSYQASQSHGPSTSCRCRTRRPGTEQ